MLDNPCYTTILSGVLLFAVGIGCAFGKQPETGAALNSQAAAQPQQTGDARLTGSWVGSYGAAKITIGFLPDGRYSSEVRESDDAPPDKEAGRYQVSGSQLTVRGRNGTQTYQFRVAGNKLTLTGGIFSEPTIFTKKSGSEKEIADDIAETNTNGNADDAAWRERIKIRQFNGRANGGNASGDLTPDPNPTRIFSRPQTFVELEVYLKLGAPQTIEFSDGSRRGVFNESKWYFFPDGRIFFRSILYRENGPPDGQIAEDWGRYTVQPGGQNEAVTVEFDGGEKSMLDLVDGRRNLQWGERAYGNLKWQQEP